MKLFMAAGWTILASVIPVFAQPSGIQSFQLPNGLRVVLLENHERSLLRLQLMATWIPWPQLKAQAGVIPLSVRVLEHCGAGGRSHAAFCRDIEERGLRLRFSTTADGPVWTLQGSSTEAEAAFAFMADATARTLSDEGGIEAQRMRFGQEIDDRSTPENARITFLSALDHPDQPIQAITTRGLSKIFLEDVQIFIHETLRPPRAVLAISGDVGLAQARQLALLNFGAWGDAEAKAMKTPDSASQPPALPWPIMTAPADERETLLALPFRSADGSSRAAAVLLGLLLPRKIKSGTAWIQAGADRWISLVVSSGDPVPTLQKELQSLKEAGLDSKDLEQSKLLWRAQNQARGSHPERLQLKAAIDALLGPEPGQEEIKEVGLAAFNATLRAWLKIDEARILRLGGETQTSTPKREARSK